MYTPPAIDVQDSPSNHFDAVCAQQTAPAVPSLLIASFLVLTDPLVRSPATDG